MTISHGSATRTALCEAAVRRVDGGSGAGKLKFLNSTDTLLCTITLADPAFGSPSGASQSLLSVPVSGTDTQSGTISKFYFTDSDDTVAIQGSVGTSGQDINLSSVTVSVNDVIQIDAVTYTAAT